MDDDPSTASWDVPLPPERAFVVQLRRHAAPDGEIFVGRVEHIVSGEGSRFESAAALLAFIARVGSSSGPPPITDRKESRRED